ncbi:MAG: hypothetical protein Aurels2KO_56710 [Aureliella sp.]
MNFKIIGKIENEETFASSTAIREIARLRKVYGRGRWRKRKGVATVEFEDGTTLLVELHWTKPLELAAKNTRSRAS